MFSRIVDHLRIAMAAGALTILSGAAPALATEWTPFADPTEKAFRISVPRGWKVSGGIQRFSPTRAGAWVTAASPDAATFLFYGDPAIPTFEVPNPRLRILDGTWIASPTAGPMAVTSYRPGADFAAGYGPQALSSTCGNLQLKERQIEPELAATIRQKVGNAIPGTRVDAGAAIFQCEIKGRPFLAEVMVATVLLPLPASSGGGGIWYVAALSGFRVPQGGEGEARQELAMMAGSFQPDPQWTAMMKQATNQKSAAAMRADQQQAAEFSAKLRRQGEQSGQAMQGRHNQFMSMMEQQRQDRNNRFDTHLRQKAWQQQNELMYIRNTHREWDPTNHRWLEVPN